MTNVKLCKYELEILQECADWWPARPWRAAVGAALEFLYARKFIDRLGRVTERGEAALREASKEDKQ